MPNNMDVNALILVVSNSFFGHKITFVPKGNGRICETIYVTDEMRPALMFNFNPKCFLEIMF